MDEFDTRSGEYMKQLPDLDNADFDAVPTCDICGGQWQYGMEGEDWNGETGNHFSCEKDLVEKPWLHPYEADHLGICIHCGNIGSYIHTKPEDR